MNKEFYVYILTNKRKNVLYVGMTGNLVGRIAQHKSMETNGFTKRYRVTNLVYYEEYASAPEAILREKQIKGYRREKKEGLIRTVNPRWDDLSREWCLTEIPRQTSG